jgi:hypothetical protein
LKENPIQQSNQSSLRSNRTENVAPIRSRERDNEQNASRRSGTKVGPMTTTSTSPIPQRSTRPKEDAEQQVTATRNFDKSSSTGKQEETGIQEQSPWDRAVKRSS